MTTNNRMTILNTLRTCDQSFVAVSTTWGDSMRGTYVHDQHPEAWGEAVQKGDEEDDCAVCELRREPPRRGADDRHTSKCDAALFPARRFHASDDQNAGKSMCYNVPQASRRESILLCKHLRPDNMLSGSGGSLML